MTDRDRHINRVLAAGLIIAAVAAVCAIIGTCLVIGYLLGVVTAFATSSVLTFAALGDIRDTGDDDS